MDLEDNFSLEHLIFSTRRCRSCKKEKDLLTDFYQTRKDRGAFPSSYSYECKSCTIRRIKRQRKYQQRKEYQRDDLNWYYPDW